MESLKYGLLQFHPDTVEAVRKDINLETPERVDEAVDLLEEWIKKQNHFTKKDFPRQYLETSLVTAKGLVERAKQKLDKLCTFRTLMPEYFPDVVSKESFALLPEFVYQTHLPKLSKQHYRTYLVKINSDSFDSAIILMYFKYIVLISDFLKMYDYNSGFVLILDFRNVNILNVLTKMNPIEVRQIMTILTEGYGMRIKSINLVTSSKMVDSLVMFFKQALSAKLGGRINVHKNIDTLHQVVDKDSFPEDYGGKEKPLKELNEKWMELLLSKEYLETLQELNKARTDESCRQTDKFNEHYIGMPGSFRALSVD